MASDSVIIKKFVAKFVADGKDLTKQFARIGQQVANFTKKIGRAFHPNTFKRAFTGIYDFLAGIVSKVSGLISDFRENVTGIADAATKTGQSTEFISRLAAGVEAFGGSTDGAIAMVESLQDAMTGLKFGEGPLIEAAKKYGLQLHDANGQLLSMPEQLKAIEARMKGMTAAQAADFASILGLDDAALRMLRSGRMSDVMANASFVVSKEDAEAAQRLRESSARIQQMWKAIALHIQRVVIPIVEKVMEIISVIPKLIKDVIAKTGIDKFIASKIKPALNWLDKKAKLIVGAFQRMNFSGLFTSGKSFFDMIKDLFKKLGDVIPEMAQDIGRMLLDALSLAFQWVKEKGPAVLGNIGNLLGQAVGIAFKTAINLGKLLLEALDADGQGGVGATIIAVGKKLLDIFTGAFEWIKDALAEFLSGFLSGLAEQVPGLGRILKWFSDDTKADTDAKQPANPPSPKDALVADMAAYSDIGPANDVNATTSTEVPAPTHPPVVTNNNTNNTVTQPIVVNNNIVIKDSKNPAATAKKINDSNQESLRRAVAQSSAQVR